MCARARACVCVCVCVCVRARERETDREKELFSRNKLVYKNSNEVSVHILSIFLVVCSERIRGKVGVLPKNLLHRRLEGALGRGDGQRNEKLLLQYCTGISRWCSLWC